MTRTDLVFRSIGERTAKLALELAIKHIRPDRVEVIEDVRPFSEAVRRQLALEHDADQVVHVDADCLILDEMTPFLESNRRPYVDCFVTDRFRGRIHCGVHITSTEVVRTMGLVEPPVDDEKYVLRPESRIRNLALKRLKKRKEFRNFSILHDHFQYYRDIFAKYALRELRSRTKRQRARLDVAESAWESSPKDDDLDLTVVRLAVEHARKVVAADARPKEIARYIDRLPKTAVEELERADIEEKPPLDRSELEEWLERHPLDSYSILDKPRVFGIGLSRTGTRSLTMALHVLGWDTAHYPADATTFEELANARYDLKLLESCHGITDITVAPYFAQLDHQYPGSKFVLTIRDNEPWLRSCRHHWEGRDAFQKTKTPEEEAYMRMRRLLRAAVFGCYSFDEERFSFVYDQHLRNVKEYFSGRQSDLLVIDICGGQGWEALCPFMDVPIPNQPFPHRGAKLTRRRLAGENSSLIRTAG